MVGRLPLFVSLKPVYIPSGACIFGTTIDDYASA
jgi:hypothetical protein